uniref:Ig-like domain-containing protein n=1 Tax=Mesocestoides corti TaxID=53468 RepID=A0A5K3EL98_MESCO
MIEQLIVIIVILSQLLPFVSSLPSSYSKYECVESTLHHQSERAKSRYLHIPDIVLEDEESVNVTHRELKAPCFNASFPTNLVVEEGSTVTLPCVVHNVDFNSIVV